MAFLKTRPDSKPKTRYAVVGLGYIAQAAVLPAFQHADSNSELAALVSNDPEKREKLGKRYNVPHSYSYAQYDECLHSGAIDAVYIALPNTLHREYTVRAARAGIHVLCEKPMALTEEDCREMIEAAEQHQVKLMIAYRLHFEAGNLAAIQAVQSGQIGEPRFFLSSFSQQVKEGDIRATPELGGGSVYDMGIYCINAARYIFQLEPIEVVGFSGNSGDRRFRGVEEMTAGLLRFPQDRLASFVSSIGASDSDFYRILGTQGDLLMEPAFEFSGDLQFQLTVNGQKQERKFPQRDQFAAELLYFSECVLTGKDPIPSGREGLADIRIIQALYRSALAHQPIPLGPCEVASRPKADLEISRPPVRMPELVNAAPPSPR